MKITNRFKKLFALFFVLAVVIPLTSSFGVWEMVTDAEDAYAGNVAAAEDFNVQNNTGNNSENGTTEEPKIDTGSLNYKFSIDKPEEIYNFDETFTFDGVEYKGVFKNQIKETSDNTKLKVGDLGTLENPYVVLEIVPSAAISEMRPHVADLSFFDLTQEELDDIELTDDEKKVVRLQAINQLSFDKYSIKLDDDIQALQNEIATIQNQITDIENNIVRVNNDIVAYEQRISAIRAEIETTYYEEIRTAVINAGGSSNEWWINPTEWEEMLTEFCSQYSNEYDGLIVNIAISRQAIETNKEQIAEKEKEITEVEKEIANLRSLQTSFSVVNYVSNRPADKSVDTALEELEKIIIDSGIMTAKDYEAYINAKFDYALEYKRNFERSISYNRLFNKNNYNSSIEYVTQYEVGSDGNFAIYNTTGEIKTVADAATGTNKNYSAIAGEIKTTRNILNPLALGQGVLWGAQVGNNKYLITHSNTFTKGCLDVAFDTEMGETGRVESQMPFIDEYVFAGWSIKDENGVMQNINSLADDYNLQEHGITELYTNWVVKYYEKENYELLTTAGYAPVSFNSDEATYSVNLPDCVASKQEGLHDMRNQLTMCLAKQSKFITSNPGSDVIRDFRYLGETELISYVDEVSSWDFNFAIADYPTVGDLKKVAPKLMADTDYYVATKNVVHDTATNTVTYYPYNVLVITITPEELNKMVYYDPVYRGKDPSVGYQESAYLNTFLDSVDFVYFSNGGDAYDFGKSPSESFGKTSTTDLSFGIGYTTNRKPNKNKAPILHTFSGDETYDENAVYDNIANHGSYTANYDNIPDLEWQVVYKIYQRVAQPKDISQSGKGQTRSMVVVFNEVLNERLTAGLNAQALMNAEGKEYLTGIGTQDNLAKLYLMFFVCKDPTKIYDWYVNPNHTESINGKTIYFDKMEGALRYVEGTQILEKPVKYRQSSFTGVLYGYERWNQSLFLPYEYFDDDFSMDYHILSLTNASGACELNNPWNGNGFNWMMWEAYEIARNCAFKNIANPYAYTYNGNNALRSDFYTYNIDELSNNTNSHAPDYSPSGNTDLAFEYFRRVKPGEIKEGRLATKSAIEFMVQNAHNSSIITNKEIIILNKAEDKKRIMYNDYMVYVDTIIVDDFSAGIADVEYMYKNTDEGCFVPEILWTKQYSNLDNNYSTGKQWYYNYTQYVEDDNPLKWYKMPTDLDNLNKDNYYISYNITYNETTDSNGNTVTERKLTRTKALQYKDIYGNVIETEKPAILAGAEYHFEALLKPIIDGETHDQRTYIIAVKQYDDYQSYKDDEIPESIVIKNVVLEKLTYLFNLD